MHKVRVYVLITIQIQFMKRIYFFLLAFCAVLSLQAQDGSCDCTFDPSEPFVCVADSTGTIVAQLPNACFAACFGLTVVEGDCDFGGNPFEDCDCEFDPEAAFICATDSTGHVELVPNACFAECLGLTVVDGDCDFGGNPSGCDCEIDPDAAYVCAVDSTGLIFEVVNACFAECLGFTVVEGDCGFGGGNPFEDCDCEIDYDQPFICAIDSLGFVEQVPNACFAACLGLEVVNDSLCAADIDLELGLCISDVVFDESTTFQSFLLLINELCEVELPECILSAPVFDNDEDFIDYLMANCLDSSDLGSETDNLAFRMFNSYLNSTAAPSSVGNFALPSLEIELLQNPVDQTLRYQISSPNTAQLTVGVFALSGQRVYSEQLSVEAGEQSATIDLANLPKGMYLLNITNNNSVKTLKFIRQ